MEKQIIDIVAGFLKVSPDQLGPETKIDRKAVGSSIALHRMYARLAGIGFVIEDYSGIQTLDDLLAKLHGRELKQSGGVDGPVPAPSRKERSSSFQASQAQPSIGIDIESVSGFPIAGDFRTHEFYQLNFSQKEIAYAILQPDPLQTFAGMFAAKEAIIKASEGWTGVPFNQLEILHDAVGKPLFEGFAISISHQESIAVAVAIRNDELEGRAGHKQVNREAAQSSNGLSQPLAWISIVVSLLALMAALWK